MYDFRFCHRRHHTGLYQDVRGVSGAWVGNMAWTSSTQSNLLEHPWMTWALRRKLPIGAADSRRLLERNMSLGIFRYARDYLPFREGNISEREIQLVLSTSPPS